MRLTLAECLGWPVKDERDAYAEVQERSEGGVSRTEGGGGLTLAECLGWPLRDGR